MKKRIHLAIAAACAALAATGLDATGLAAPTQSDHSTSAEAHAWTGVWQGKLEGFPGVTITLTDDTGNLAGTIVFNALDRMTGHVIEIVPRTVLQPHMEGNALAFQVKRIMRPHLKGEEPGAHDAEDKVDIVGMVITPTAEGRAMMTCPKCGEGSPTQLEKLHGD